MEETKPRYTSDSKKFHPRVRIDLSDVVAIVSGRPSEMYLDKRCKEKEKKLGRSTD